MSALNVGDVLEGYSKAMYSTWFYYGPDRALFDAGEGVASRMENRAFAIRRVFLSHGHLDHISGLPTLVHIRMAGMGEKTKPLQVFYPRGDGFAEGLKAHLDRAMASLRYELTWHPLEPGDRVPLTDEEDDAPPRTHQRWVDTFPTKHARGMLTLGYRVMERRARLLPEFAGRPQADIRALVQQRGKSAITEEYDHCLLAYLGDTAPISPDAYRKSDILMHEATFLDATDRARPVHSTLEEAARAAVDAEAGQLVLFHLSSRYSRRDIRRRVPEALEQAGFDTQRAWLCYERHMDRVSALNRHTRREG